MQKPEPALPDRFVVPADRKPWKVYPTDVSQFVSLQQCERFLRLRLHEQTAGLREFRATGATPQQLPPLLADSGAVFEGGIEATLKRTYRNVEDWAPADGSAAPREDNRRLAERVEAMTRGETLFVLQPALRVEIGPWLLSGKADVIRFDRDESGVVSALIVDIKASAKASVPHKLQVAFYQRMVEQILAEHGVRAGSIRTGILFKGVRLADLPKPDPELERKRAEAIQWFAAENAFLEIVEDPGSFLRTADDLLLGPDSVARKAAAARFDDIPFHLGSHCDKCVYNEFCLRDCVDQDDLSLLPFLSQTEKKSLQRCGITTMADLARLKRPAIAADGKASNRVLAAAPGREEHVRRVASTWPVGPRIDELVHRARRYRRWRGDDYVAPSEIPGKSRGSLPYCDPAHNPNLIRVYIEAHQDYLQDRVYALSALVTGAVGGAVPLDNRRFVIEIADGPPEESSEASLLVGWSARGIRAIGEVAAPDEDGTPRAPIHLIVPNAGDQRNLLAALSRHADEVVGSTALYDFVTQQAGYDSPVLSLLEQEVRDLKNVPMLCQPIHLVAERFQFRWRDSDRPYNQIFRHRLFDYWTVEDIPGDDEAEKRFYVGRARFYGGIPLEYVYAAWGALPSPPATGADGFRPYRHVGIDDLDGFLRRRLEAMEHVANQFKGNRETVKTPFSLPDLDAYADRARDLPSALAEFLAIERHVKLSAWKQARYGLPELRALAGVSLPVSYHAGDQTPGVAASNAENLRLWRIGRAAEERWHAEHPDGEEFRPHAEEKKAWRWSQQGLVVRLRVRDAEVDIDAGQLAELCRLKAGETVIVVPRWREDLRVPAAERSPVAPSPKLMLYLTRGRIGQSGVYEVDGRWYVDVVLGAFGGGASTRPWVFGEGFPQPFEEGAVYTIEEDPNNWNEFWQNKVIEGIAAGSPNVFFEYLNDLGDGQLQELPRSAAALDGQRRFYEGLAAFHRAGLMKESFEASKEQYIGANGSEPILLVQGPPGTGKSYTSGFAVLARAQGALESEEPFRAILSSKTHSAVDVLLASVLEARGRLAELQERDPRLFDEYIDRRLLNLPLYRLRPNDPQPAGVEVLPLPDQEPKATSTARRLEDEPFYVAAGTPGSVYRLLNKGRSSIFGATFATLLVLDEASQMSLPEALMAALPLAPDAQIIVVGDHRQMPPIVQHDWAREQRKTFEDYAVYRSLFDVLRTRSDEDTPSDVAILRFEKSFRLHRDMAAFLRREVYAEDKIAFSSDRLWQIEPVKTDDDFVRAVLSPEHPLTVVVHDEDASQQRNPFERTLIAPVAQALMAAGYDLAEDFGVVVPHRAQRAEIASSLEEMAGSEEQRARAGSAVDTVERFQGGERRVIVISATESDPGYLLAAGKFLYDPRRLTVALSRAKQKLVLVASREVFTLFSPDEETFENTRLWKNLLRETCTKELWSGARPHGGRDIRVQVFGNEPEA
ncbi:MAG: AAA domain-containing protein [Chloroflexota bacterium]